MNTDQIIAEAYARNHANQANKPVSCPGCGRAHPPHPETGTWCTAACMSARLNPPKQNQTPVAPPPANREPKEKPCNQPTANAKAEAPKTSHSPAKSSMSKPGKS